MSSGGRNSGGCTSPARAGRRGSFQEGGGSSRSTGACGGGDGGGPGPYMISVSAPGGARRWCRVPSSSPARKPVPYHGGVPAPPQQTGRSRGAAVRGSRRGDVGEPEIGA